MERELKRSQDEFEKINNQIIQFEEEVKSKRKEIIKEKIKEI
jgi:hypothetical protein